MSDYSFQIQIKVSAFKMDSAKNLKWRLAFNCTVKNTYFNKAGFISFIKLMKLRRKKNLNVIIYSILQLQCM